MDYINLIGSIFLISLLVGLGAVFIIGWGLVIWEWWEGRKEK